MGSRPLVPQPLFLWNRRDAPGTVADFDATQFFTRFHIDNRDVIRCAVGGVDFRPAGIERDAPDAVSDGNRGRYMITLCIDDD